MHTTAAEVMIHGDGSAVCRYANRPQWGSIDEDLKGVYRRLHETALSRAAAARVEMEDPNSSVELLEPERLARRRERAPTCRPICFLNKKIEHIKSFDLRAHGHIVSQ